MINNFIAHSGAPYIRGLKVDAYQMNAFLINPKIQSVTLTSLNTTFVQNASLYCVIGRDIARKGSIYWLIDWLIDWLISAEYIKNNIASKHPIVNIDS